MIYYSLNISRGSYGRRFFSRGTDLLKELQKVCAVARMDWENGELIEAYCAFVTLEANIPAGGDSKILAEYLFRHNSNGYILEIERADSDSVMGPGTSADTVRFDPKDVGDGKNARRQKDWVKAAAANKFTSYTSYCLDWARHNGEAMVLRPDGTLLIFRCPKGSSTPYRSALRRYKIHRVSGKTIGRPPSSHLKVREGDIKADGPTRTEAMWEKAGQEMDPPRTAHQCAAFKCPDFWGRTTLLDDDGFYVTFTQSLRGRVYSSARRPYYLVDPDDDHS